MSKKFDPERKRLKRLDIYSTGTATGAGVAAGLAGVRGANAGVGRAVAASAGSYKDAMKARQRARVAPNKGLARIARNRAGGAAMFGNAKLAEAGKIIVRNKGVRNPLVAAATLGAASLGASKYKKSESAKTYGEYKVYGQRSRKTSK